MDPNDLHPSTSSKNNLIWHHHTVTKTDREIQNGHKGAALWFSGLSGSGKSTIADSLETALHALGVRTYILDGDNVRHGLCRDLGFSDHDRRENIRRIGEVAKLMVDAGLIALTAFISPHRNERKKIRSMFDVSRFIEVFVDTPLSICEARDPKKLYRKARAGQVLNFTGISAPFEAPKHPDIYLDGQKPVAESTAKILRILRDRSLVNH